MSDHDAPGTAPIGDKIVIGARYRFRCMSHEAIRERNGLECVVVGTSGDLPWYHARFEDDAVMPCHRVELTALPSAPSGATTEDRET